MIAHGRNAWLLLAAVVLVAALAPFVFSEFFVSVILTKALWLGVAAASLTFLSAYGGMVSLAQVGIYGVAGMAYANLVLADGGNAAAWAPWLAVLGALLIATAVGLGFGAIASRSEGIYFLMITLTYAVIGFYFFGQVTTFSGFGGMTGIRPPGLFLGHPKRLYYAALILSGAAYLGFRAIARTPFGMALQGVRDDPIRMASLGFDVQIHRMLAFTLAGFVAGLAGILNIWWNGQIDPTSIGISPTLDLFIIAVIGGIVHLEGAWLGAFVFVGANIYLRDIPLLGSIDGVIRERILAEERFNTVVGLLLLVIMLTSPDGLAGMIARLRARLGGRRHDDVDDIDAAHPPISATNVT